MNLPIVTIVGRPNVGKSTLFNRLVGRRQAIVADEPGTTRDRLLAFVDWNRERFLLVDTGGLEVAPAGSMEGHVRTQVDAALNETDVVLFVADTRSGLNPADSEVAALLRRRGLPVVVAANKCEGEGRALVAAEFHTFGLGDPVPISALQNQGIGELMDRLFESLPPADRAPRQRSEPRLALVGRPNVGKSSVLNAIVGQSRSVVHSEPGTTRDALDTPLDYLGRPVTLIDTAGIRRRGSVQNGIERFSVLRAMQAIHRSNVAVLVLDATEMVTAQDTHVAGYVVEAHRGLVIAINKWDRASELGATYKESVELVRYRLPWISYAPICFTSALSGQGVTKLMDVAMEVYEERWKQLDQGELNRTIFTNIAGHPTPSKRGRHLRVFKVIQHGVNPPAFQFFVNDPALVHFSYQRFLENILRKNFGFRGNHLRMEFQRLVYGARQSSPKVRQK